nr:flagellar assembly protein FliW [Paenibacillus sp. MSJ-34]
MYFFEKGIVGLQEHREYALVPFDDSPFLILHAVDEELSFILLPAENAVQNYGFHIDEETVSVLKAEDPGEIDIMLIVNIIEDQLYVNLKAPILLCPKHQTGCQFIITDQDYPIRQPLSRGGGS